MTQNGEDGDAPDHDRLRFEGRWVFDSASALGGRYIGDQPGDALAADAQAALAALIRPKKISYRTGEKVSFALTSGGKDAHPERAPSLVWHAQAVGTLLELGYMPSAECVRSHLDVLRLRLDPANADDPAGLSSDTTWYLRTRHVAWVLACLSELHAHAIPSSGVPESVAAEVERHREIVATAISYLTGDAEECQWIGGRAGETFWSEHWEERRPNLLNSIYASGAICRAVRHGFPLPPQNIWGTGFAPASSVGAFFDSVHVVPTRAGPRTRLDGQVEWAEPWAKGDLPAGVVGLITIGLLEYAHLLLSEPDSKNDLRAKNAYVKARRTAHDLLSRDAEWLETVDAFSYQGVERKYWFVPTYSVALRAILETGAAKPGDPVITAAIRTIGKFARSAKTRTGDAYQTWGDPTRANLTELIDDDAARSEWHARIDLAGLSPEACPPTASSIHASVMAFAAFRRGAHATDPRALYDALVDQSTASHDPASPFTQITVGATDKPKGRGRQKRFELKLAVDDVYEETCPAGDGDFAVLIACNALGAPATDKDIADEIGRRFPGLSLPLEGNSVRDRIAELNDWVGVGLIKRDDGQPVRSRLSGHLLRDDETLPDPWRTA